MTRASLREYAAVQRERYRQARGRTEKRQLLDEIVAVTGMHRKAVIRWLRRPPSVGRAPIRSGRPRRYGAEIAAAAEVLWQASGRIGAHRLHPFVSELLDRLVQCGELSVPPTVDKLVRQASRPTLARLLGPARARYPRRGATTTHPSTWLKQQIPIRNYQRLNPLQLRRDLEVALDRLWTLAAPDPHRAASLPAGATPSRITASVTSTSESTDGGG